MMKLAKVNVKMSKFYFLLLTKTKFMLAASTKTV
jgi:hypothetical protein